MSTIDSGLLSSLAANMMAPTASQMGMGLAGLYNQNQDDQRRRPAPGPTARPMTPGMGTPLTQHIIQASQQPQPMQQPQQVRPQVQGMPPQEQDYNPAGVTLGEQEGGGRNVELIRGGHSEVQHFNAAGDNTGVLPPANSGPAAASAAFKQAGLDPQQGASLMQAGMSFKDAMTNLQKNQQAPGEKATWKDQMTADKSRYDDAVRRADHATTMLSHFGLPADKKAALAAEASKWHSTADALADKVFHPNAVQNYQDAFRVQESAATQRDQQFQATQDQLTKLGAGPAVPLGQTPAGGRQAEYQGQKIPAPPKPGTLLPPDIAKQIYEAAGRDPTKARQLAAKAGWSTVQ